MRYEHYIQEIRDRARRLAARLSILALDFSFELNQFSSKGRNSAIDKDAFRACCTLLLKGDALQVSETGLGKGLRSFRVGLGISLEELRAATSEQLFFAANAIENIIPYTVQEYGTPLDHAERITAALFHVSRSRLEAK